ncbi:MAG: fumarylacetoacetate hydrolase family protein [Chitinophagaceae bacterium]|nr:fumarylacetoacetate hydrolase family protein [Chitinophagaceae bacterium]
MKLFRFGEPGDEKPAIELPDGRRLDVSAFGDDYTEIFFDEDDVHWLHEWVEKNAGKCPEVPKDVRTGPCISRPSKIVCVGLNYAKHAAESGMEPPNEPVLFFKSTTALCGPYDNLIIPKNSVKTDWEVELAVIIGKKASYVTEEEAMDYVAGYAVHNDYSEREYQLERGGQWVKGKSCDTFAPIGPYLVTKDEVADPHNLRLWLDVNGKRMQDSNTSDLIFKIPFLISYISQFMTLLPDDVISTGTPQGVGLGQKPPLYLKAGDVVTLGIEGLGEQKQVAVAWPG